MNTFFVEAHKVVIDHLCLRLFTPFGSPLSVYAQHATDSFASQSVFPFSFSPSTYVLTTASSPGRVAPVSALASDSASQSSLSTHPPPPSLPLAGSPPFSAFTSFPSAASAFVKSTSHDSLSNPAPDLVPFPHPPMAPPGRSSSESVKHCNCKQSRCLKLYCECLARGAMCNSVRRFFIETLSSSLFFAKECFCVDCHNNEAHHECRDATIQQIASRNPAFKLKLGSASVCFCFSTSSFA